MTDHEAFVDGALCSTAAVPRVVTGPCPECRGEAWGMTTGKRYATMICGTCGAYLIGEMPNQPDGMVGCDAPASKALGEGAH